MLYRTKLIAAITFLLAARSALANNADDQEKVARTACLAGDYTKGVTILSELFVATKTPAHIFNQGRCFEQNHRYEDAIARFQEYLRVGRRLSKAEREDATGHIASCQALLAKQADAQASSASTGSGKEARERAAKKACLNGDPRKGVEILTDLYVDINEPTYIFNQGRCYEQNNLCEEAIVRFREYLRKTPNGTEHDRADAAKHIADCEALLAKKLGSATENPKTAGAEAEQVKHVSQAHQALSDVGVADETRSSRRQGGMGGGLRVAGVIAVSAGGVFTVAGITLNLKHNSLIRELQGDYNGNGADSADRYKTWSTVGYAAGVVCVVGGGVLYLLGKRGGKATVVPDLAAGRTGVLLAGPF